MLLHEIKFRQPIPCVRFDWVVIKRTDCFGTGFLAHPEKYANEATMEGFVIVQNELTQAEAFAKAEQMTSDQAILAGIDSVWS